MQESSSDDGRWLLRACSAEGTDLFRAPDPGGYGSPAPRTPPLSLILSAGASGQEVCCERSVIRLVRDNQLDRWPPRPSHLLTEQFQGVSAYPALGEDPDGSRRSITDHSPSGEENHLCQQDPLGPKRCFPSLPHRVPAPSLPLPHPNETLQNLPEKLWELPGSEACVTSSQ